MDKFIISDEIMQNAKTYLPIADKQEYAETIAKKCVKDLPTADGNLQGEKLLAFPYMKGEDRRLRDMCLLTVFLGEYLHIKIDLLTEKDYDYYLNDAVFNQIERFKSNFKLKDKAFDLLYDFKELRKMVEVEINNLISVYNDPLARFVAAIQVFSTPENVKKIVKEIQKQQEQLQSSAKAKSTSTAKKTGVKEITEKTAENIE